MKIADVNEPNRFRVKFLRDSKTIKLWYNGKLALSCTDPLWPAVQVDKFIFSQYGNNVQICKRRRKKHHNKHRHHKRRHNTTKCKKTVVPKAGGFSGVWDATKAFKYRSNFHFFAKGNDIYLATFTKNNLKSFLHLIIISGWNNAQTKVYRNGNIQNSICDTNMKIADVNAANKFRVKYKSKAKIIQLWYNGKLALSCFDPQWPAAKAERFIFSQYGSNVQICKEKRRKHHHKTAHRHHKKHHNATQCKTTVSPKAGGFSGVWDTTKAFKYRRNFKFAAKGNDIYLATFNKNNLKTFLHLIIISGWNNSQTKVYRNGNIQNSICETNMKIADVNAPNKFKVKYNKKAKTIQLWYNGKLALSCFDPQWPAAKAERFIFSQYGSNVQICKRRRRKHHHKKHHHHKKQNATQCKRPVAPKQGGFSGVWDTTKAFKYRNNFKFAAKGNDIYLATFAKDNLKSFLHLIIISGWNNSQTKLYRNGNIQNSICDTNMKIADVNAFNKFKIKFNKDAKTIQLWYDGKLAISCFDPQWPAAKAESFIFSQYGTNVQICQPRRIAH
jgi:Tfp pilus assembly protein PilW